MREYQDVFPEDLPGVPPERDQILHRVGIENRVDAQGTIPNGFGGAKGS